MKEFKMDASGISAGSNAFSVDPSKVASVGDANQLEVQKTMGAGFKELEALRSDSRKITTDGVDVKA
ncbi:MAG: hypothetical protein HQ591_13210 [candidate division Zixibacteria bacterium]|nr:hypothetical protein [Candidatus Tariuqbacter arcticus]